MIITKVTVSNFRSIRNLEFLTNSMVILLGPNNHGKSNILQAIEFALSTSAKVDESVFFAYKDNGEEIHSDELWVEITFDVLTEQERITLGKYILSDGTFRIRKYANLSEDGSVEIGYRGYIETPEEWWLQSDAVERINTRPKVEALVPDMPALAGLLDEGGAITKTRIASFQRGYIEAHRDELNLFLQIEDSPFMGAKNVGGGILPEFYLVPAVRDLGDEAKYKTTTTFGRLVKRAVSEMTEEDERLIELRQRLREIVDELNERPDVPDAEKSSIALLEKQILEELKTWGDLDISIQVSPPEIEKIFELGTELYLDDGLTTTADKKGHGLQRAVIFSLMRAWANIIRAEAAADDVAEEPRSPRKSSESVIFAIEEPELYLHPHAQRQLAQTLDEISQLPENQVIVSSHSTHFIDLEKYKSIGIVTKPSNTEGTIICQCVDELFEGEGAKDKKDRFHMAFWINPDRGEIFFARKVVFVEGETEKAVFPYLAKRLGFFDPSVSIIDCGSKHNLPLYIQIANAFNLSYVVIHDEDPLPDPIPENWEEDKVREKRRTFELNQTIADLVAVEGLGITQVFSPDIEGMSGVSRTQGKKCGKALAALEYFASLNDEDLPQDVIDLIRAAYA